MKYLFLLSLVSGCAASSGGGANGAAPSNPQCVDSMYNGQWQILPGPTDTLTANADCTGRQSRCGQNVIYTKPTGQIGTTNITFLDAPNGQPGCPAVGTYACSVNYNSTNLSINCGGGAVAYTKLP